MATAVAAAEHGLPQQEQQILNELTELLRSNGETILSGQSKLSLTTRSLCLLNACFASLLGEEELVTSFDVAPPSSPKLALAQNIQFLYDFTQKAIALKILHVSSTLQGRVNLGPFRALRTLEIKKTPLHLLEGIQLMRGRLVTIICSRSLSSLQELFETCGGDLSTPMSWPELRTANLSFNMIEKLDSSLRLVPELELLDLSHNSIEETERCLEYLTEVTIVNLGYNRINHVPSFSISARSKLSTLIVRNNNLEHLAGIEELVGLKELDCADNCLCDHKSLTPLRSLNRLAFLVLKGNPLCYHEKYRLLTIGEISRTAACRVTLDGRVVSKGEIQAASKLNRITAGNIMSQSTGSVSSNATGPPTQTSYSSLEASFDSPSEPDSGTKGTSSTWRARRGGRSTRRVRQALIADIDSESERPPTSPDTSKPSTPQCTEHLDVKKHMETMRNQLGPDWLQTLVHSKDSSAANSLSTPAGHLTNHSDKVSAGSQSSLGVEISKFSNKNKSPRQNGTESPVSTAASKTEGDSATDGVQLSTSVQSEPERVAKFAIGSFNEEEQLTGTPPRPENMSRRASVRKVNRRSSEQLEPAAVNYGYASHRGSVAGLITGKAPDTLSDHIDLSPSNTPETTDTVSEVATSKEEGTLMKSGEFKTIYDRLGRMNSLYDKVDYGVESEPFIVSHLNDPDSHYLVSVTQRYLLEKDINGDVIEALDLRSLLTVSVMALGAVAGDDSTAKPSDHGYIINLTFDYVKKDRRERQYLIEDESSAEHLRELLQPVVEVNQTEAQARGQMHCMKCYQDFNKQSATRTVRRKSTTVYTDLYSSSSEKITSELSEALLCPFCLSDMIIKVDTQPVMKEGSVHTPMGSLREPLATSSTNTTPHKQTDALKRHSEKTPKSVNKLNSNTEASSFQSIADQSSNFYSTKESSPHILNTPGSQLSPQTFLNPTTNVALNAQMCVQQENDEGGTVSSGLQTSHMSHSLTEVTCQEGSLMGRSHQDEALRMPEGHTISSRSHSYQDELRSSDGGTKSMASEGVTVNSGTDVFRKREDSCSSEIIVLSRCPPLHTFPSQESDITLLSNPSESSIAVINSSTSSRDTFSDLDRGGEVTSSHVGTVKPSGPLLTGHVTVATVDELGKDLPPVAGDTDLSPAGSLTNKTLSSMVNSVYEKSILDGSSPASGASGGDDSTGEDMHDGVRVVSPAATSASSYKSAASYQSSASTPHVVYPSGTYHQCQVAPGQNTTAEATNPFFDHTVSHSLGTTESNGDNTPTPSTGAFSCLKGNMSAPESLDASRMPFSYNDFSQIDHRLKLHLMMTVFVEKDEQFVMVVRCGVWHYAKATEWIGVTVVSSHRIYFFKTMGAETVDNPAKWLKLVQSHPISELRFVDIGLGYQTLRLEFAVDSSCFTLMMRDEQRCKQFTTRFTSHVQSTTLSARSMLESITKNNPQTLANLRQQVLEVACQDTGEWEHMSLGEGHQEAGELVSVTRYIMAHQPTGGVTATGERVLTPVSLIVTPTFIHLVDESFLWPPPHGATDAAPIKQAQFTLKDSQRITNITQLDLYQSFPLDVGIIFYDEESREECTWRITMETVASMTSFVDAVKQLWDEQFGVDLQISLDNCL